MRNWLDTLVQMVQSFYICEMYNQSSLYQDALTAVLEMCKSRTYIFRFANKLSKIETVIKGLIRITISTMPTLK